MERKYWENEVRPVVIEVLNESGKYENGEQCFITAYQIAALVNKKRADIESEFPTGGEGAGPGTLAQGIARYLSDDEYFEGKIERAFLSVKGLDAFKFSGANVPSNEAFSMFRLIHARPA